MMPYSHSFSPEVYGDPYDTERTDKPTTLADALASMPDDEYLEMVKACFPDCAKPEVIGVDDVLSLAIETDTVTDLSSPLEFWIDPDGGWRVLVYEEDD
jgi:hypothetical protein